MKIKKKEAFVLLFFIFSLMPVVSAEIVISEVNSVYNKGDHANLTLNLIPVRDTSGFFTAELVCENTEIDLYKSPYSLTAGSQKKIDITLSFDRYLIGDIEEECYVRGSYGEESAISQTFLVSSNVKVSLNIDGFIFDPGDKVNVVGKAIKENEEPLDGFVEVSLPEMNLNYLGEVKSGEFNFNFTIPVNSYSGTYNMNVRAYEKDSSGNIINEGGIDDGIIRIKQLMKGIEVILGSKTVAPEDEFSYRILIYDQAKEAVQEEAGVVVYSPDNSVFEKKLVRTGEPSSILIGANYTPGDWKIEAKRGELSAKESFFVEELRRASFSLENSTLIIVNTGNVIYDRPLEVTIGGIKEIKEVELGVGESKKLKLFAPPGEYPVGIDDGTKKEELGNVFLTGKAISVGEVSKSIGGNLFVLIWLLVIVILIIAVFYFYKKISNSKYGGTTKSLYSTKINKDDDSEAKSGQTMEGGKKEEAVVIALRIKNISEIQNNDEALKTIDGALWKAKDDGAKIYNDGDYRIVVLSPSLTKQKENTIKAVNVANNVERILREYNKRSRARINFGIGINTGDMAVEMREGKFKFVSMGSTVSTAKKISMHSNGDVLISDNVHRKSVGKIKTEKMRDNNFWKVLKVTDRTEHEDFINKFKQRQKRDEIRRTS